jgi:hypothetical protein
LRHASIGAVPHPGQLPEWYRPASPGASSYRQRSAWRWSSASGRRRFPGVQRVFVGALPDLDRAEIFLCQDCGLESWSLHDLNRHDTHFGVWRTEDEVTKLTTASGWCAEISRMPPPYYGAHFRFDVVLTPL